MLLIQRRASDHQVRRDTARWLAGLDATVSFCVTVQSTDLEVRHIAARWPQYRERQRAGRCHAAFADGRCATNIVRRNYISPTLSLQSLPSAGQRNRRGSRPPTELEPRSLEQLFVSDRYGTLWSLALGGKQSFSAQVIDDRLEIAGQRLQCAPSCGLTVDVDDDQRGKDLREPGIRIGPNSLASRSSTVFTCAPTAPAIPPNSAYTSSLNTLSDLFLNNCSKAKASNGKLPGSEPVSRINRRMRPSEIESPAHWAGFTMMSAIT